MSPEATLPPTPGRRPGDGNPQAGAGLLGAIAALGLIFAMVQGTLFYRAKSSARFIAAEKNKILAQQIAEAGIEENIADLGSRKVRPFAGMTGYATYTGKSLGAGTFTTLLTTLALGAEADTLELTSQARVAAAQQSVRTRIRLKRYLDTSLTPILEVEPETTYTNRAATWRDSASTVTVQDPMAMPAIETTPAYAACLASSAKKCDICHIPNGNPDNRHVIDVNKNAVDTHIGHHGDYVTTDGTCDIYNPRTVWTYTDRTGFLTDTVVTDRTVYDTVAVVDTLVKVQILSWK